MRPLAENIDYAALMRQAMHGLIRAVLDDVSKHGLPGDHHFFITFATTHPGVAIADWLRERYPEDMTIVLQNWFRDLEVTDDGFSITLNFGNDPETLVIPFAALRTFVDPSVEFGLRFDLPEEEDGVDEANEEAATTDRLDPTEGDSPPADTAPAKDIPQQEAVVVSLDHFRKS